MSTDPWELYRNYDDRGVDDIDIADLSDLSRASHDPTGLMEPSIGTGGNATYREFISRPSMIEGYDISTVAQVAHQLITLASKTMGQSSQDNVLQSFLSCLDRHGSLYVPPPSMNYGYTFITRPRLNMSIGNLRQSPFMTTLATLDENSVPFMIRALLDTRMSRGLGILGQNIDSETEAFAYAAMHSGLVQPKNPFFTPLCNGLKGISGFPDFTLETETTEGDFYSSDFTFAKGSDMNMRTQELSLEFKDIHGCIILSCIYYWIMTIALQARGVMMAYQDDIYENRLNYTVSIYRFVTDQTRRNILWWAKATGCFPKSAPVGALFNVSQDEVTIAAAQNFSVPFTANKVEVNNPAIFMDFNALMDRYWWDVGHTWQDIDVTDPKDSTSAYSLRSSTVSADNNLIGMPYIVSDPGMGVRISWRAPADVIAKMNLESDYDELYNTTSELSTQTSPPHQYLSSLDTEPLPNLPPSEFI